MVKTPKGELTGAELRKLIRAHNILVSIKIPKGTDREGLIKLIEDKGYKVDHKKKAILDAKKDRPRRPKVTLDKAKELTKPKPLTEEQKKKRQQAKQKKEGEKAFLKTVIPKPPPVSKPSKGVKVGKPPPKIMDRKKEPKDKNVSNNKKDMDFKIGDTYLFKTKNEEIEGIVETIQEKSVSVFYKTNEGDYKSRRVVKGNVIKRLGGTNYNEDLKKNFKGTSPKKQEKKKEEIKIDFEKTFNEAKKKLDMFISQNKDLKTKDFSKFNKVNDYRKEINYDLFFEVSKLNDKLRSLKLDKDQREKVEKQREKILELNKQIKLTYKFRKNPKG